MMLVRSREGFGSRGPERPRRSSDADLIIVLKVSDCFVFKGIIIFKIMGLLKRPFKAHFSEITKEQYK